MRMFEDLPFPRTAAPAPAPDGTTRRTTAAQLLRELALELAERAAALTEPEQEGAPEPAHPELDPQEIAARHQARAEADFRSLANLSPEARLPRIENARGRYASPQLVTLLLAEARGHLFGDPRQAVHWAELAAAVAMNASPPEHGRPAVKAALARAWGELGNALRVCGRLAEAEKWLHQAVGTAATSARGTRIWSSPSSPFG